MPLACAGSDEEAEAPPAFGGLSSVTNTRFAAEEGGRPKRRKLASLESIPSTLSEAKAPSSRSGCTVKVVVGQYCSIGGRPYQEDRCDVERLDSGVAGVGVYDGHGGAAAAEYLKSHALGELRYRLASVDPRSAAAVKAALVEGYRFLDRQLLGALGGGEKCGSCAVTVTVVEGYLVCANVGDCRAVLSRGSRPLRLSTDHKVELPGEKARIESAGGQVVSHNGQQKILLDRSLLAVARAFGDAKFKQCDVANNSSGGPIVCCVPAVDIIKLQQNDDFLIVASDGVWDALTDLEAVGIVQSRVEQTAAGRGEALTQEDLTKAAQALITKARSKGSTDNATAVVATIVL
mmetsp:Transcript_96093/g.220278  ORF Transcript_96093/g.220278 Transcript_96093/m.220278 type:complete len:348 (+) Transcript_96093:47-1090(+)